jgi:hypothetical protein
VAVAAWLLALVVSMMLWFGAYLATVGPAPW